MWPFNAQAYPTLSVNQAGEQFESTESNGDATYDYIIVGGGTAGCCLAARLSEDPSVSVLLLERGGIHETWFSRIPMISSDSTSKATPIVKSQSSPLSAAKNRTVDTIVAETFGGGSSINSMLVTRAANDFNHWAELGHSSWSYASLKPYFIKSENSLSQTSRDHGYAGPYITKIFPDLPFETMRRVTKAATTLGFGHTKDLNATDTPVNVCTAFDIAVDSSQRRVSTYSAYLPNETAQERKNRLKICVKAVASRIEFDSGVAVGVHFESSDKSIAGTFYARARKEIVVCCGAIGTPHLLLLSGVGPKEHLREHHIEPVIDLPGVGSHLQDHVGLPLEYEVPIQDTLHYFENSALRGIMELAKYLLRGTGALSQCITPMAIFANTDHLDEGSTPSLASGSTITRPNIEIMPIAHAASVNPQQRDKNKGIFSFMLCILQPQSRGTVRLASRDPRVRPLIDLGFLTNQEDYAPFRKGAQLCARLAEQVRADGYPVMKDQQVLDDENIDEFIRAEIRSCCHYSSTCRMGKREKGGVLDDELKVYGVQGLRVCDASAFPVITSGHTMAPVIAVAERCADLMKQSFATDKS